MFSQKGIKITLQKSYSSLTDAMMFPFIVEKTETFFDVYFSLRGKEQNKLSLIVADIEVNMIHMYSRYGENKFHFPLHAVLFLY